MEKRLYKDSVPENNTLMFYLQSNIARISKKFGIKWI
jgi:hypothetical protein